MIGAWRKLRPSRQWPTGALDAWGCCGSAAVHERRHRRSRYCVLRRQADVAHHLRNAPSRRVDEFHKYLPPLGACIHALARVRACTCVWDREETLLPALDRATDTTLVAICHTHGLVKSPPGTRASVTRCNGRYNGRCNGRCRRRCNIATVRHLWSGWSAGCRAQRP